MIGHSSWICEEFKKEDDKDEKESQKEWSNRNQHKNYELLKADQGKTHRDEHLVFTRNLRKNAENMRRFRR